ncbi:retrotransposon protein [Cucumis melo var. makuwa]|uniref:Retrotransposon protein n=1 Tax=Cucumis melo var. makuwa TaxID=1194695 RepID=A0A5D3BMI7_CUCMM|nr:retrotransposon protein [Cucumis melo var. makuwa]
MKLKGKMEELDVTAEVNTNIVDRSKYKKLEMPMFLAQKVKVAVVSFGQDEVDWYRWNHNLFSRHPQTLEDCMKEAQLVNNRNLALKLSRAELGIHESKGGEPANTKAPVGNEKGNPRKNEFQMK